MVTEMITLKLDKEFLKEIDAAVKEHHYHSRTEFVRESLRRRVKDLETERLLTHVESMRGALKDRKTTDEEYERNRELAFREISRKLRKRAQ